MWDITEDKLTSTDISSDDWRRALVIVKIDTFFQTRKNNIFKCEWFNWYNKKSYGESAVQFITNQSQQFGSWTVPMVT